MVFDPNQKNVAPMYLATVRHGAISYRLATMEKGGAPVAADQNPSNLVSPPMKQPAYARVGEDGVGYNGPQVANLPAGSRSVVVFGPQAAKVAQGPAMQAALKRAPRADAQWRLIPVASDQNWGAASTQLVHALMDEHPLAIIALDRDAAHLAEQLALKTFIPVVALSSDKALTSTNVPWIFRMDPATTPAAALELVRAAVRIGGSNPERLRDVLASGKTLQGIAFLPTGEPKLR
jgi:adenine/guanine phosphoribosyltransferase-like PRPP-binding protein